MSTKEDVLEQVARNLGDFRFNGVITTASNNGTYSEVTINDILSGDATDFTDGYTYIESNTYRVATFNPTGKTLSMFPSFATLPATSAAGTLAATIRIYKDFSKDDYDTVFDSSFERLAGRILVEDVSSQAVSTLIDYAAPSTWKYANSLELYATDSQWPRIVDHKNWTIRNASIRLGFTLATTGSYATISFIGQKHPTTPATDSTSLDIFNQIFRDCLTYRMEEQLGLRKLRTITQTQTTVGTVVGTVFGTVSVLATTSEVATLSGVATSTGTLAVLEHVTGREERSQDNELQSSTEDRGAVSQSAETTDSYTLNREDQHSRLTEEDWSQFVAATRDAADALELYLYERPKVNSRRIR